MISLTILKVISSYIIWSVLNNEIPIGFVSREVRLYLTSQEKFSSSFTVIFDQQEELLKDFVIYPATLKAQIHDFYISFKIGAKASAKPGIR